MLMEIMAPIGKPQFKRVSIIYQNARKQRVRDKAMTPAIGTLRLSATRPIFLSIGPSRRPSTPHFLFPAGLQSRIRARVEAPIGSAVASPSRWELC